jgi:hypothetical protein
LFLDSVADYPQRHRLGYHCFTRSQYLHHHLLPQPQPPCLDHCSFFSSKDIKPMPVTLTHRPRDAIYAQKSPSRPRAPQKSLCFRPKDVKCIVMHVSACQASCDRVFPCGRNDLAYIFFFFTGEYSFSLCFFRLRCEIALEYLKCDPFLKVQVANSGRIRMS